MADTDRHSPETVAATALGLGDGATGGVVPAIHLATTFERDRAYALPGGRNYIRPDNAAGRQPEIVLNALEGGVEALTFGSGMAAATAVFQALAPGDHVVVPRVMYWALRAWLTGDARRWGLEVDVVDMADAAALAAAIRPGRTKLVWVESPANPTWDVTDVAAAAEAAHRAGARLAVDNTVPTPVFTRPLALGADIVMHSATKYLNGHSDVLAGALVTARDDEFWRRIVRVRSLQGGMLGAVESWLLLRGMRTLHLRVRRASDSAQAIAEHFARHPKLEAVLYPGLPDHPGHAVARRQMEGGFGGMLSIRVKGGAAGALGVAGRLDLWRRATSLGGVESLVEHRASVEGADSPVPPDLLRLSVGIEHPADLIADLEQALAGA
ncbi:MAG: cystathionine gamma-synthase [Alphaproteobacteria bacterium]|nr:MAG: cystathionine gamma-synthase [Alphaproteobacteria bacterium]